MRTVSADCRAETGPKCKHNNDDDLTSLRDIVCRSFIEFYLKFSVYVWISDLVLI